MTKIDFSDWEWGTELQELGRKYCEIGARVVAEQIAEEATIWISRDDETKKFLIEAYASNDENGITTGPLLQISEDMEEQIMKYAEDFLAPDHYDRALTDLLNLLRRCVAGIEARMDGLKEGEE